MREEPNNSDAELLSWPRFALVRVNCPDGAPTEIKRFLEVDGVPERGVGNEYVALREAMFLDGFKHLLAFGRRGPEDLVCVEIMSGEVVTVSMPEKSKGALVNSSLGGFVACVEAMISEFPFYSYGNAEDVAEEVAEILKSKLLSIDAAAIAFNGFWETFIDDVAMGNYADEEYEPRLAGIDAVDEI